MDIFEINIQDIKPADYNPRKIKSNEYEKLKRSISDFGFVDPIIVNLKNMVIIGGHQRYDIIFDEFLSGKEEYGTLKMVRLGDVGWVFTDDNLSIDSESKEKALNIALNKISGEWDNEKLNELMGDLSVNDVDISLTGFDELELEQINLVEDLEFVSDDYEEDLKDDVETSVKKIIKCPHCGCEFV